MADKLLHEKQHIEANAQTRITDLQTQHEAETSTLQQTLTALQRELMLLRSEHAAYSSSSVAAATSPSRSLNYQQRSSSSSSVVTLRVSYSNR